MIRESAARCEVGIYLTGRALHVGDLKGFRFALIELDGGTRTGSVLLVTEDRLQKAILSKRARPLIPQERAHVLLVLLPSLLPHLFGHSDFDRHERRLVR